MKTIKLDKKFAVLISALILVSAVLGSTLTQMYFPQIGTLHAGPEDPLEAWSEASYVTWQYNSTYYACRNMSTNIVDYFGASDDAAIQWGIDRCTSHGGSVYVKAPTYTGTYSASVTLKDNVTLILDKGARGITVSIDSGADGTLVDYENGIRKEWVAGVLYTFMDLRTGELWWQGENCTDTLAFPEQTASYIVFQDGSLTKMKNGTTGQIDASSTVDSDIINWAVGNGTSVFIKAGLYELDTDILLKNKTALIGEYQATILKLKAGVTGKNIISLADDNVELTYVGYLTLDGNNGNVFGTSNGILYTQIELTRTYSNTPLHRLEYLIIAHCKTNGLQIGDPSDTDLGGALETSISNVFVWDVGWDAFRFNAHDLLIDQCTGANAVNDGFHLQGGDPRASNLKAYNCLTGFDIESTAGTFDNLIAEDCSGNGFTINWGGNVLGSCVARYNGKTDQDQMSGFVFGGDGDNCVLTGCKAYDSGGYQDYGVYLLSGANGNVITSNNLVGNVVAGLYDASGQTNKIYGNVGFVTENSGTATISSSTTVTFNHGLASTPMGVWASFNSTAVAGWTWTATTTQITITITPSGTYKVYWMAEYKP
jgi:hypothetical protein